MKIFITGAGGFIGSHVVRELVVDGHEVAFLSRLKSNDSRLRDIPGILPIRCEDTSQLLSQPVVDQLTRFAPDSVVHLGWAGVGNADRNQKIQLTNLPIISDLVDLAASAGARYFVGLGSQAEYGPCEGAISEDQPINPTTLYGAAKASACQIAKVMCELNGLDFSWVRVFSTYGPGDEPYWMIQDVSRQILDGKSPKLTPGTQRWDYLYVDDAARAIALVASAGEGLGILNLGSGTAPSIRDIVLEIVEVSGVEVEPEFGAVDFRPDQVMHLEADITKLKRTTGWEPKISLKAGLTRTVDALKIGNQK